MTSASFVCPFCPLHCDDLDAAKLLGRLHQQTLPTVAQGAPGAMHCPLLAHRLGPAITHHATARQASESTVQLARGWIARARSIKITGPVIDLQSARAVCRFAERTGASVLIEQAGEPSAADAAAHRETLARDGMFATTLGDAAAPHCSLILIGDCSQSWPRLLERLAPQSESVTWERTDQLASRLAHLRRLIRRVHEPVPADDPDVANSRKLCERAISVVFIVAPGNLDAAEARPFWSTMSGLLRDLNPRIRAALLRFDECLTFRSVRTWSENQRAENAINACMAEADVVIELMQPWTNGFTIGGTAEPRIPVHEPHRTGTPAAASKRITIGGQPTPGDGVSPASQACHLAASIAGIGRGGVVLRGDGSVALPLRPLVETVLPSAAEVLDQLLP